MPVIKDIKKYILKWLTDCTFWSHRHKDNEFKGYLKSWMNTETMANFRQGFSWTTWPAASKHCLPSFSLPPWGWKIDEDGYLTINFENKNLFFPSVISAVLWRAVGSVLLKKLHCDVGNYAVDSEFRVSLCFSLTGFHYIAPSWPGTHSGDQEDLELAVIHLPLPPRAGIKSMYHNALLCS